MKKLSVCSRPTLSFSMAIVSISTVIACGGTPTEERQLTGFEALSGPYFSQPSPGAEPQLFMPGLISTNNSQGSIAFLDDGKVCVYSEVAKDGHDTYFTAEKDGHWTAPRLVPFHNPGEWIDYTSPDGRTLYFQSSRPTSPDDTERDSNTWLVEWTGEGWTESHPLPSPPNSEYREGYPSATLDGTLYFFSTHRPDSLKGDIFRSRFMEDRYQEVERLAWPINTPYFEADPFIAPDESYLLFGSARPGVLGTTNTYISFRKEDGGWTHPVFLGNKLNCPGGDIRIRVTPDGKYFFFYTKRPTEIPKGQVFESAFTERHGDGDIYWSDTRFIDELKTKHLHSKCAAEVIGKEYRENGITAAANKLKDLYSTDRDSYHFLPYEFLAQCEKMIHAGKIEEADQFHRALLNTLPETARLKVGYAVIYALNDRMSEALEFLQETAAADPTFDLEKAVYSLSEYPQVRSKNDAVLESLRFNTREFPNSYMAFFRLAEAYEQYGERELALENCRKAQELNPDSIIVAELSRKLEFQALSGPYLGQKPPGTEPQIFMPGLVSTHDLEGCVGFLNQGRVFVFFRGEEGLLYTFEKDGRWTRPQRAPFQNQGFTDFTAGPDGRTLYFQSRRPTTADDEEDDANTWAVDWNGSGWTEPYLLPPPANTDEFDESYPSMAPDGSLYFFTGTRKDSRVGDVYRSRFMDGEYGESERFEEPINTDYHEVDPVVAPDGSYLLFGSGRPGGFGTGDLYVCFRRDDGSWTHPHNAGETVNPLIMPIRMSLTPDGKYFLFLSDHLTDVDKGVKTRSAFGERYRDTDVYWVETRFIEDLRKDVANKKCAAELIRSTYRDEGIQATIEKLKSLYPDQDDAYYFELSELIMLCGRMIEVGKMNDADGFYEALLETLPDTFRIKQGYALAHLLNGSAATGLDLLSKFWIEYPSAKSEGLGMLTHQLSAYSKTDDELLLLQFYTKEFPESAKAYYNLAQAYSRLGEREQAIQSCQKSLELEPDFTDAVQLLDTLKP